MRKFLRVLEKKREDRVPEMLKSWSIKNFKAIVDSSDLKFAPVTVLAGLNSSGKSSLLQSILVVSQTLMNPIQDRALLPNGQRIQLGTFDNILTEGVETPVMSIGFELEIGKETPRKQRVSFFTHNSVKVIAEFSENSQKEITSITKASSVEIKNVNIDIITDASTSLPH